MARRGGKPVSTPIAKAIVVEGQKREFLYFQQAIFAATGYSRWTPISANGGDPTSLLSALNEIESSVDQVYIVADSDRMPPYCSEGEVDTWKELFNRVATSGGRVSLIDSAPCIEVWFLLHFTLDLPDVPPGVEGRTVKRCEPFKRMLAQLCPGLDNRPIKDWNELLPHLPIACANARKLRTRAGTQEAYSNVDLLMREMGLE